MDVKSVLIPTMLYPPDIGDPLSDSEGPMDASHMGGRDSGSESGGDGDIGDDSDSDDGGEGDRDDGGEEERRLISLMMGERLEMERERGDERETPPEKPAGERRLMFPSGIESLQLQL